MANLSPENIHTVYTRSGVDKLIKWMREQSVIAADTEFAQRLSKSHDLLAVQFSAPGADESWYLPIFMRDAETGGWRHHSLAASFASDKEGWEKDLYAFLRSKFSSLGGKRTYTVHNISADIEYLDRIGLPILGDQSEIHDTMFGSYLLGEKKASLKHLAEKKGFKGTQDLGKLMKEYLTRGLRARKLRGAGLQYFPHGVMRDYAGMDPVYGSAVFEDTRKLMDEPGYGVFRELQKEIALRSKAGAGDPWYLIAADVGRSEDKVARAQHYLNLIKRGEKDIYSSTLHMPEQLATGQAFKDVQAGRATALSKHLRTKFPPYITKKEALAFGRARSFSGFKAAAQGWWKGYVGRIDARTALQHPTERILGFAWGGKEEQLKAIGMSAKEIKLAQTAFAEAKAGPHLRLPFLHDSVSVERLLSAGEKQLEGIRTTGTFPLSVFPTKERSPEAVKEAWNMITQIARKQLEVAHEQGAVDPETMLRHVDLVRQKGYWRLAGETADDIFAPYGGLINAKTAPPEVFTKVFGKVQEQQAQVLKKYLGHLNLIDAVEELQKGPAGERQTVLTALVEKFSGQLGGKKGQSLLDDLLSWNVGERKEMAYQTYADQVVGWMEETSSRASFMRRAKDIPGTKRMFELLEGGVIEPGQEITFPLKGFGARVENFIAKALKEGVAEADLSKHVSIPLDAVIDTGKEGTGEIFIPAAAWVGPKEGRAIAEAAEHGQKAMRAYVGDIVKGKTPSRKVEGILGGTTLFQQLKESLGMVGIEGPVKTLRGSRVKYPAIRRSLMTFADLEPLKRSMPHLSMAGKLTDTMQAAGASEAQIQKAIASGAGFVPSLIEGAGPAVAQGRAFASIALPAGITALILGLGLRSVMRSRKEDDAWTMPSRLFGDYTEPGQQMVQEKSAGVGYQMAEPAPQVDRQSRNQIWDTQDIVTLLGLGKVRHHNMDQAKHSYLYGGLTGRL